MAGGPLQQPHAGVMPPVRDLWIRLLIVYVQPTEKQSGCDSTIFSRVQDKDAFAEKYQLKVTFEIPSLSIWNTYILFYKYSILFYSILFYSILFY